MMSNQQQTYQGVVGVQQAQPPGLLNSQRNNMGGQMQSVMGVQQAQPPGILSSQRSGMGNQMQGLMVQYTPLPSYQVGICCSPGWGAERGSWLGRMCPVPQGWSPRWGFAQRAMPGSLGRAYPCGDLWDTSGAGGSLGGATCAWVRLLWAVRKNHESLHPAGVSLGQFSLLCYLLPAAFLPAQVPMASESQNVVQQPFQQPVLVPASQSVQGGLQAGGVPIYYSVIPTAQQNGTR